MLAPFPGARGLTLAFCGLFLVSSSVRAGSTVNMGLLASGDTRIDMAVVAGNPAIASSGWLSGTDPVLKYVRATDADGTAWGSSVTLDVQVVSDVKLMTVNGHPAVCYTDISKHVKFVRATDAEGHTWGAPVAVYSDGVSTPAASMEIVDGNPAVCVTAADNGLKFIRATDPDGTAWGPPVTININSWFYEIAMKQVEGRPAIVCVTSTGMFYVRSADAAGTAWNAPVTVVSWPVTTGIVLCYPSVQIVNGRPAICFKDPNNTSLSYIFASNAEGTAWQPKVRVDPTIPGYYGSLATVQGKPLIAYSGYFAQLICMSADDGIGATREAWGLPLAADSRETLRPVPLEVNGRAAIAYHDTAGRSLRYVRAATASAPWRWPADIRVELAGARIFSGHTTPFGGVTVGDKKDLTFSVKLTPWGAVDLALESVTLSGPHAAEFSITIFPDSIIAPSTEKFLKVRHAPLTPGKKSAFLSILSNAQSGPFEITLTGESLPDIAVEHPAGTALTNNSTVSLSIPDAGSALDFPFTIRNPGDAELNQLAITIDGSNAAEFSVVSNPAPVAPGGSTAFTIRHAPAAAGPRVARLRIASSAPAPANPFTLNLRTVPGLRDPSFQPEAGIGRYVALQADGKILAGGFNSLERFHPDGRRDLNYFAPTFDGGYVFCIAVQKDGMILAGGAFNQVNGFLHRGLARFFPDGTVDASFVADFDALVRCIVLQPDGKILAGGDFRAQGGGLNHYLARLHPNGTRDLTFQSPGPGLGIICMDLQPDSKVLVGGLFWNIGPFAARQIARLHPDGSLDRTFTGSLTDDAYFLCTYPNGTIAVSEGFTGGLSRLTPGGVRDPVPTLTGQFSDFALQADGRCLVARNAQVARITPGGALDPGFNPAANGSVGKLALQSNGKVITSGNFPLPGGGDRFTLQRLNNDFAVSSLIKEGPATVRWMRSGSAPEVRDVTFDAKPSGADDWSRLGSGTRIPGGWELSGPSLPSSGQIRAQAYAGGSVMEAVTALLTPLESWRLQHFNTSENTGGAADDADPDHDGLTNFTEYAFGLNPVDRASSALPPFMLTGASFTATFTAPEGRGDVTYSAAQSLSMQPGTWTEIPDTGVDGSHVFNVPAGAEQLFVRFVVRLR